MEKVICFGAAGGGKRLFNEISEKYEIIAFTDNDKNKIGKTINGIAIYSVDECLKMDWDVVVITSAPGLVNIKKQLISMGIDSRKIDTSFIELPLLSRISFLEKLSKIQNFENAAVAEVGVFEGDFAKWINQFYDKQRLHLFDTFEGFDKRDMKRPMVLVEPGRYCVGNAGITLYTVGSYKYIRDIRDYISVDGGMTDNIRSSLYNAKYDAVIANKAGEEADHLVTVAGKNCESGDILIKDIMLQDPQPGDILAMFSTGAYHYSMSSNYNQLPKPAVVFTYQGHSKEVIRRQTFDDLVAYDVD